MQFHPDQMTQLRAWCEKYEPRIIVEVGSWLGKSTSVLGQYAKESGGIVFAVDWWQDNPEVGLMTDRMDVFNQFKDNMKELGLDRVVIPMPMLSFQAVEPIADNSIDMVFIDANHRYSSVKEDIDNWLFKVKRGGVMCGHDFEDFRYDEKYIEQDVHDHKHHGVIKAVTETFRKVQQEERMWLVEL